VRAPFLPLARPISRPRRLPTARRCLRRSSRNRRACRACFGFSRRRTSSLRRRILPSNGADVVVGQVYARRWLVKCATHSF